MFFILTSGALAVSFIPVFNQRLMAGNKKSAVKGNVCVCKEGPVFDINDLTWEV